MNIQKKLVCFPPSMVEQVENLATQKGFASFSEAVRAIIRGYFLEVSEDA
jgi:metal-responsive CopG/Arc/MetJ family transcriptional regulator